MTEDRVERRRVFFLSGFDPKGASHYHRLYREQAALQAAVTRTDYTVSARGRGSNGNPQWHVRSESEGLATETTFEFVQWDDVVRAHWPRSGWSVFARSFRAYRAALASPSALKRVWHASRRTLVALAFPLVYWFLSLILGLALGAGASFLASRWVGPGLLAWTLGAAAMLAAWQASWAIERRLNTSWLLRIFQFADEWRADRVPELNPRLQRLAEDAADHLASGEVDEVLLVGFSVGSLLATRASERLQQVARARSIDLSRFTMMTLGQCIPLVGLMAGADGFRRELARLGQDPRIRWVDFSSLTDWGSFPLVDPLALCLGAAGAHRPHRPVMASPRFHTMFDAATYARIVRNKRRMHLQYLMAGERISDYDYFAITAGPRSLAHRISRMHPSS